LYVKAQARAKTYADQARSFKELELGDMVFFKMTPKKSQLRLGKCYKFPQNIVGHSKFSRKLGQWLMN
jgi:hypothetical protein